MNRHLIVFAKAPVPGSVKTRLHEQYTPQQAAAFCKAFIIDVLSNGAKVPCERRTIFYAPMDGEKAIRGIAGMGWELQQQGEGDLGARMAEAFNLSFAEGADKTVLVGADSPSLPPTIVSEAFGGLMTRDLVLGPSMDGGYYLIGASRPYPKIFHKVAWSTDRVLGQTLERIGSINASLSMLPPWYDVDTPEELDFLAVHMKAISLSGGKPEAPETLRMLEKIGKRGRRGNRIVK